ncbi:MAG: hypothetical protein HZY79_06015 [Rhodoblastus sp.]|nr:MAG: hypothetical protein HZY79_06015 [Rhodoblastus sp.]
MCYIEPSTATAAAEALAAAFGPIRKAMVIFDGTPFGDDQSPGKTDWPDWRAFREWRRALSEARRLADAPAHRLEHGEDERLRALLEHAIKLGWDARILVEPGGWAFRLSHDDRIEFVSGASRKQAARALAHLGWRRA